PLLLAQHAPGGLAVLELLQDEISAGLCALHSRIGFSFSHAPLWHRASGRARRTKSDLPTVCNPTPMDPVCCAGNRTLNLALARSFIPFLQRICAQYDRGGIARRIYRALRASIYRIHFGYTTNRKCHSVSDRGAIDPLETKRHDPRRPDAKLANDTGVFSSADRAAHGNITERSGLTKSARAGPPRRGPRPLPRPLDCQPFG